MDETEDETGYKGWKLMKRMKFNVHFEIWKEFWTSMNTDQIDHIDKNEWK